jgi:hypothetical protein
MLRSLAVLAVCLACAVPLWAAETSPPKTHPDSSAWQKLFADDLSDADFPKGIWFWENGELTATEDRVIWT